MNGLVAFAFGAGMLSTVNPCGFALLPAFLAYNLGSDNAPTPTSGTPSSAVGRRVLNGLATGALVSVGSVSYTHLDVYKRQVSARAERLRWRRRSGPGCRTRTAPTLSLIHI